MNINLELYKVFYHIAKNKSISKTANELMITQPAISKSIKNLEEQINTKLFIRKKDGVILTEAGKLIYDKIKSAMELINSAEMDLLSLTNMEKGYINIGASKTIIHEYLMPLIKDFHHKHPNVNIKIFTDRTDELIRKTKLGLIDVIFINMPFNIPLEFKELKLMELHDCLVANETYNYLKDKTLSKKDIENLPLLLLTKGTTTRTRFDDYCLENNISVQPKMEFGSNTLIKDFTETGFGIGLLSKEHIKEELISGKLFELNIKLPLKEKHLSMLYIDEQKKLITDNFISYIKENTSI